MKEKLQFYGKLSKKDWGNLLDTKCIFDLHDLYDHTIDPQVFIQLEEQFTKEEIEEVVKNLPSDKSPGPDGFNNEFIKACWDIIKEDIIELMMAFHAGTVNLESINTSYITLIPKKKFLSHLMISGLSLC